jgi:copper chaperone CopZ
MKKSFIAAAGLFLAATAAQAGTIELKVNGLVCSFCAQGIEKSFRKNPATADVVVSLEEKLVAIETKPGADIDDAALRATLKDAGYDVRAIERTDTPVADIRARLKKAGS